MLAKLFRLRPPPATDETVREKAGRLFESGYNCTQSVLMATTDTDDPALLEMADAFGGGISDTQCLCGAVTGGVMALGLKGKGKKAAALVETFKSRNKVTCCKILSRPYKWNSKEHLANCRRLTEETAAEVAKLLR